MVSQGRLHRSWRPGFFSLPPILYRQYRSPISGYSKAPRGLSVLPQVTRIFTGTTISPSPSLRQCPSRYAFRAGRNLPDKEFRYLRTVIVTAAVYWGFGSELAPLPLTFQHRAGVSPYTSAFALAGTCVFGKQSLGPILCDPLALWQVKLSDAGGVPLLPKLRGHFAEFLNEGSLARLGILSPPTCVGFRYGHRRSIVRGFSWQCGRQPLRYSFPSPSPLGGLAGADLPAPPPTGLDAPFQPRARPSLLRHPILLAALRWHRNFHRLSIAYAIWPRLRSRLTLGGRAFPRKP